MLTSLLGRYRQDVSSLKFHSFIHSLTSFMSHNVYLLPNNNDAKQIFVHNFFFSFFFRFFSVVFVTHKSRRCDEEKLVFFGLEQTQFNYCPIIASLVARATVVVVANCLIICLPCLTESWFALKYFDFALSGTVADSLKPFTHSSLDFASLLTLSLFKFTSFK